MTGSLMTPACAPGRDRLHWRRSLALRAHDAPFGRDDLSHLRRIARRQVLEPRERHLSELRCQAEKAAFRLRNRLVLKTRCPLAGSAERRWCRVDFAHVVPTRSGSATGTNGRSVARNGRRGQCVNPETGCWLGGSPGMSPGAGVGGCKSPRCNISSPCTSPLTRSRWRRLPSTGFPAETSSEGCPGSAHRAEVRGSRLERSATGSMSWTPTS